VYQNKDGLNNRPHPSLLPRGEGEKFAAFWECFATELAGASSHNYKCPLAVPSPWGEGQGEGGDLGRYETLKEKLKPYLQTGE
jgi:hypothetical protein